MSKARPDQELTALLWDPSIPTQEVVRGEYARHVRVADAVSAARSQGRQEAGLEDALDAIVKDQGGFRYEAVEPGRWIPDLLRKLAGRPVAPSDDYYGLPSAPDAQDEIKRAGLER